MYSIRIYVFVSVVTTLLPAAAMADPLPSFQGLGDLPGGDFFSEANAVSADGLVVVGTSTNGPPSAFWGDEAFRWTAADGMVGLGDLPGGFFASEGRCVSANGSVVAGSGHDSLTFRAVRWTQADGMTELGSLPGGEYGGFAEGMSADGSVIVGYGGNAMGFQEPFLWSESGGMTYLDPMPGAMPGPAGGYVIAKDVSGDGSIVVGHGTTGAFSWKAFRWTEETGMAMLGHLSGSSHETAAAYAISADGAVIVGGSAAQPFRWTAAEGMVGLGGSGGANAVSADGSVIVGGSSIGAFVWDEANGRRELQSLLADDLAQVTQ